MNCGTEAVQVKRLGGRLGNGGPPGLASLLTCVGSCGRNEVLGSALVSSSVLERKYESLNGEQSVTWGVTESKESLGKLIITRCYDILLMAFHIPEYS